MSLYNNNKILIKNISLLKFLFLIKFLLYMFDNNFLCIKKHAPNEITQQTNLEIN